MADRTQTDELNVFNEVQRIIDGLIKFDADSRMRIYRTVGTFFGFDGPATKAPQDADRPTDPTKNSREPHFSTHEAPSPKDFVLGAALLRRPFSPLFIGVFARRGCLFGSFCGGQA